MRGRDAAASTARISASSSAARAPSSCSAWLAAAVASPTACQAARAWAMSKPLPSFAAASAEIRANSDTARFCVSSASTRPWTRASCPRKSFSRRCASSVGWVEAGARLMSAEPMTRRPSPAPSTRIEAGSTAAGSPFSTSACWPAGMRTSPTRVTAAASGNTVTASMRLLSGRSAARARVAAATLAESTKISRRMRMGSSGRTNVRPAIHEPIADISRRFPGALRSSFERPAQTRPRALACGRTRCDRKFRISVSRSIGSSTSSSSPCAQARSAREGSASSAASSSQ